MQRLIHDSPKESKLKWHRPGTQTLVLLIWLLWSLIKDKLFPHLINENTIYWKESMYMWTHISNLCCSRVSYSSFHKAKEVLQGHLWNEHSGVLFGSPGADALKNQFFLKGVEIKYSPLRTTSQSLMDKVVISYQMNSKEWWPEVHSGGGVIPAISSQGSLSCLK